MRALDADLEKPPDLADVPGRVVGFFGLIEAWVDLELIAHMAKARPDTSFVLIGRVAQETTAVDGLPNVYLLGQRPYTSMPAYMKYFDVCLIPFVVNDVIENSNPLKLKEYLAGGKPVVTVPIRAVDDYRDHIYVAGTYDEFLDCVDRALEEDSPERARARVAAMEPESWPAKVDVICERVSRHIPGVHNE
jgi:glycosyltransferase involved in cell wall biosynthesis